MKQRNLKVGDVVRGPYGGEFTVTAIEGDGALGTWFMHDTPDGYRVAEVYGTDISIVEPDPIIVHRIHLWPNGATSTNPRTMSPGEINTDPFVCYWSNGTWSLCTGVTP